MKTIITNDNYCLISIVRYNLFSVGETVHIKKIKHRKCNKCETIFTIKDFCGNSFDLSRLKHEMVSYRVGTITFCSECGEVLYYVINDKPKYLDDLDDESELFVCCQDLVQFDNFEKLYNLKGDKNDN